MPCVTKTRIAISETKVTTLSDRAKDSKLEYGLFTRPNSALQKLKI